MVWLLLAVLRWTEPKARNGETGGNSMNKRASRTYLQTRELQPRVPLLAGRGGEGERSWGEMRGSSAPLLANVAVRGRSAAWRRLQFLLSGDGAVLGVDLLC